MSERPVAAHEVHGEGPPVVLVHSFPLDRRMWAPQVEPLAAAGFRAITVDLPGFGETPLPPHTDPSLEVYADAVIGVLDHLRVDRAAVVGLSLGGYVALRLAARSPNRLDAVVLADTRAGGDSPEARAGRLVNLSLVRARGAVALTEKMLPHLLAPGADEAVRARVRTIGGAQSPEGVTFALLAMRDRPDSTAVLPTLRSPALVMVGSGDTITPPAAMRAMAEALPDARFVEVEGCGHLSSMERPDAFNDGLMGFLLALRGVTIH